MKRVNEKCDVEVDFDDAFKADSHILSIVSKVNRMIGWMVIPREAIFLNIYKTQIKPHIEYCIQASARGMENEE